MVFERKRRESIKDDIMTSCPRTTLEVPAQAIILCHITPNQKDMRKSALQNSLAAPLGCFNGIVSISNVHTCLDELFDLSKNSH